jgi:hypothetical protein
MYNGMNSCSVQQSTYICQRSIHIYKGLDVFFFRKHRRGREASIENLLKCNQADYKGKETKQRKKKRRENKGKGTYPKQKAGSLRNKKR